MKKSVMLLLCCFLASSVFAKGIYSGDVQIRNGFGFKDFSNEQDIVYLGDSCKVKTNGKSGGFSGDISTLHLFSLNDFFSLGFNVGLNGQIGYGGKITAKADGHKVVDDESGINLGGKFLIGPAVGLTIGEVVRFNIAVDFALGFCDGAGLYSPSIFAPISAGFAVDVQAKFVPKSVVSPVIGYRFSSTFADHFYCYADGSDNNNGYYSNYNYYSNKNISDLLDKETLLTIITNEIYVGISFNW